jgi:hypothetical protein
MRVFNLRNAALALVAGIGLGGCAYGPYGGLGVGVGYGNNGYYDPYYGGGYGYGRYGASYGYGAPYYGWYDGFYYPGTGYYVYDRYRRPYRWSDRHRRYWEGRRDHARQNGFSRMIQSWGRFEDGSSASPNVVRRQGVNTVRTVQADPVVAERQQVRAERRQARQAARSEKRGERGDRRRGKKHD